MIDHPQSLLKLVFNLSSDFFRFGFGADESDQEVVCVSYLLIIRCLYATAKSAELGSEKTGIGARIQGTRIDTVPDQRFLNPCPYAIHLLLSGPKLLHLLTTSQ